MEPQNPQDPEFGFVSELARALKSSIVVYDLEATTFRGRPNFAITEVWCFLVTQQGPGLTWGNLINPERSIEPEVQKLTGITPAMVRNEETWGVRYADLFKRFAEGEVWVCGFNNQTFDNHAVKDMNLRYGRPIEGFSKTFDVRQLHRTLSGAKSAAGTLVEIAALYGIQPSGNLHRAQADTVLTLELLNAIVQTYGVEAVAALILPKPVKAVSKLTAQALAKYVSSKSHVSLADLEAAFQKPASDLAFEVGKAIDERLVSPEVFAVASAQDWLMQAMPSVSSEIVSQGKLRPILTALQSQGAPSEVDYIQLRVSLLRQGHSWASLKPST